MDSQLSTSIDAMLMLSRVSLRDDQPAAT